MDEKRVEWAPSARDKPKAKAHVRWYDAEVEPCDVWKHVSASINAIDTQNPGRSALRLTCARLYSNKDVMGFGFGKWGRTASTFKNSSRTAWNVCKAVVDAGAANVAKSRPKVLFLTDNGDYQQQDQAKGLTSAMEALFDTSELYASMQRAFVDAEIFDVGFVHTYWDGRTVKAERVFCEEIRVDELDGADGRPRQIHRVKTMALGAAMKLVPDGEDAHEKRAKLLLAAAQASPDGGVVSEVESVVVRESYWAACNDEPGRWALTVEGCTLDVQPFDDEELPFIELYWTPPLLGYYGQGVVEELIGDQLAINRTLRTIEEAQELACVPRVFLDASTEIVEELDNEVGGHYRYTGRPPIVSTASAMPPEMYQHLQTLWQKCFEKTGVSQLSASSQKPAGLDSGAAIREYKDIGAERFNLIAQRFEAGYMKAARLFLNLIRKNADAKGFEVKCVKSRAVQRVKWKEVNIDDDMFVMRPSPVSSLPSDPAGKKQFVSDLMRDGLLTDKAAALSLLDFQDLEAFISLETAALDDAKMMVDRILTEGEMTDPDEIGNVELTLRIAQSSLLRGRADRRPQQRLDLLLTFIEKLRAIIDKQAAAAAQPPPMGMMPPGPGGMPPMPPMPPGALPPEGMPPMPPDAMIPAA